MTKHSRNIVAPASLSLLASLAVATSKVRAQDEPTGRTVEVNGIQMYYEAHGEGAPLVLLHGFGSAGHAAWGSLIDDFSTSYRVILPDLRGHGRSTNPAGEFTHRQSAGDVFALVDELGITQFKAMGISTGGMTLIHMATQQPERVEAMVLIGATIYFPEQARAIMRRVGEEELTEADLEGQRQIHKHGDEQIRTLRAQFHGFKDSYDDMNFTGPYLGTIKARTLIVHGDRDEFFPVAIPVEMYQSIPNAALWIIPNGGHVPIFEPQVPFAATARKFLSGEDGKDSPAR
jgi:pimeloyl-ACP methyl ester carboxylesterase